MKVSTPKRGNIAGNNMGSDQTVSSGYVGAISFGYCKLVSAQSLLTVTEDRSLNDHNAMVDQLEAFNETIGNLFFVQNNFLTELADVQKCSEQINTLSECLKTNSKASAGIFIYF